jgi:hypothetical protein
MVSEAKHSSIDDTQAVNTDVDNLYETIIRNKIDVLRSSGNAPGLMNSSNQTIRMNQVTNYQPQSQYVSSVESILGMARTEQVYNSARFVESRAHAFLRILGFPIAARDGTFFSSGFDPKRNDIKIKKIIEQVNQDNDLKKSIISRENEPHDRRKLFALKTNVSTAYALAMKHVRPFLVIDKSKEDPFATDEQKSTISDRQKEIEGYNDLLESVGGTKVTTTDLIVNATHKLKPFVVSSMYDYSMPSEKRIAAPFLNNKDLVIDPTKHQRGGKMMRPVIELIIRERLGVVGSSVDTKFQSSVQQILGGNTSASLESVKTVVQALMGDEDIHGFNQTLSTLQVKNLNLYVRTIKGLVNKLRTHIDYINAVQNKIIWQPLPNAEGPEWGGVSRTSGPGVKLSPVAEKIGWLKLLELYRGDQQVTTEDYAMAFYEDIKVDFSAQRQALEQQLDKVSTGAINSLKAVEIITGEVSGLGLIDILAFHTALWSIDIEALLGFLDNDAFERLYNTKDLGRHPDVVARYGEAPDIINSLKKFEAQLINVLAFADLEFTKTKTNPRRNQSSNVR